MFSCLPYSLSQYLIEANVVHNVRRINLHSTINDLNTADTQSELMLWMSQCHQSVVTLVVTTNIAEWHNSLYHLILKQHYHLYLNLFYYVKYKYFFINIWKSVFNQVHGGAKLGKIFRSSCTGQHLPHRVFPIFVSIVLPFFLST